MRRGRSGWICSQACRWLAGLETGVWAGLAMLGWFALTTAWTHRSIWEAPTRLGSLFYRNAPWSGFSGATLAGMALHLAASGGVGVLFSCLAGEGRNRLRVSLWGILTGLTWYYLSYLLLWGRLGVPPASRPQASLLAAYLIFGAVLSWYPRRLRSAEQHLLAQPPPPTTPAES
jgi:hypothetical protein